ncbi:hypothetical protein, partial [Pseudomonas sp. EA_15y_Pfl1_P104]|uniref:hypothetical protein n=1 Tax=Pseudomonas sp. EA_15y_Pfl1_P104 TaxID=3088686 RepID=UPI0030DBA04A
ALHAAVNTSFSPLSTERIETLIEPNNTALPTPSGLRSTEATRRRISHNSLFTKEFSVSTAPEVGRIIDFQNLPSTLNFAFYIN